MPALIQWWTQDVRTLAPTAFDDAVVAAGASLLGRWREPHRRYHDTRHLVEVFWAIEELEDAGEVDSRAATVARIAAWFHDAVYDPAAPGGANEQDSARLAHEALTELDLDAADISTVARLVRRSADHAPVDRPDEPIERAFLDADLWILAADPERFDAYCTAVRREYAAVPEAAYRTGRAEILRGLLGGAGLYRTEHARAHWEPQARANLDRELARLHAPEIEVR